MGACGSKQTIAKDDDESRTARSSPTMSRRGGAKVDVIDRGMLIRSNPGKIQDFYELDSKKLGEGTYGAVCKGTHKLTRSVRAVKILSKGHLKNFDRFKQEIVIMKMMDHPNIIKLFETFEDRRSIYLVMELCSGGELFDRIIEAGHFTECQAAIVVQHILRAIFYMHLNGISHRDLKPENFLFLTREPIERSLLKIIDFGLSCRFTAGQVMNTKAGTPYYVAPQVLLGRYDSTCDLWSAGVIMYTLLCGYPPFYGRTDQEVLAKVRNGSFTFDPKDWRHISEDAKVLIRNLLKMNPKERFSAEQALNHDWIRRTAPAASNLSLQASFVDNLRGFRSQNRLKKAALHIIAGQLSEAQIKGLRDIFNALDANGDGLLTLAELKDGLDKAGLQQLPVDLEAIVDGVDADGSGVIDYTEFLAATLDRRSYLQEDVCWTAFSVFDIDGDGKITIEELRKVLDGGSVEAFNGLTSEELMKSVDSNGDGFIDFQEFMAMMRGPRQPGDRTPSVASPSRRTADSPIGSPKSDAVRSPQATVGGA